MPVSTVSPVSLTGGVYRGNGGTDLYNATTGLKLSPDDTTRALSAAGYNLDRIVTADAGSTPDASNTPAPSTISGTHAPAGSKLNANGHFIDQTGNAYLHATPTPAASLTANIKTPSASLYKAPASITSNIAKTDLNTKLNTINELHQNVAAQRTAVTPVAQQQEQTSGSIDNILSELDKNLSLSQGNESNIGNDLLNTQTQADVAAHAGYTKLNAISLGTYPLSPAEQGMIEATKQSYQQVLQAQATANSGALGQVTELMATLGLQHSAPIQAMSLVQSVISRGTAALATISTKMSVAVSNLEMKIQQHDFNNVQTAYNNVAKAFQDRTATLEKMQSNISKASESARTGMLNYARTAIDAIVSSNKATEQQKKDAATAVYEAGMLSAKHYANITARINATKPPKAKMPTQQQKNEAVITQISKAFTPTFTMPSGKYKGQTVLDSNGYIKPEMWKYALKSAQQSGISRRQFINEFGNYIYVDNTTGTPRISRDYGLTGSERRLLTVK